MAEATATLVAMKQKKAESCEWSNEDEALQLDSLKQKIECWWWHESYASIWQMIRELTTTTPGSDLAKATAIDKIYTDYDTVCYISDGGDDDDYHSEDDYDNDDTDDADDGTDEDDNSEE